MSRLYPNQTNITPNDAFFLKANVSTLTVSNLLASNISTTTLTAKITTLSSITNSYLQSDLVSTTLLEANSVSSLNLEANFAEISTVSIRDGYISSFRTDNIILDGNTLDTGGLGFGSVLLLNGLPIATGTSSLSSIADWSFFPALSTLQMGNYNISNAGNITCQNIFNALNVQTDTLSALTSATAPSGVITTLRTSNFSSINLTTSNATIPVFNTTGLFTTGLSSLAISTGSINGIAPVAVSNWSQFPANSAVALAGFEVGGVGTLRGSNIAIFTSNTFGLGARDVGILADEGVNLLSPATVSLTAQNGTFGQINLTANSGFSNGVNGVINLTANGGNVGGVGQGGTINLTANTPIGFSNLTSKISLSASGINSYAGVVPPLASAFGYNFVYGTNGVYIAAGIPPGLPNVPGTTYIYGTLGVEMPSDLYLKNIYPYFDGITTPPDINIEGRYIVPNLAQVCVRMSNVRQINFQDNVTTFMSNLDTLSMSGTGSITTSNLGATVGTIGTLSNTNLIGTGVISGYSNITTSNLTVTTINGAAYPPGGGGSVTNQFSTLGVSSLGFSTAVCFGSNAGYNLPFLIDYDHAQPGGATNADVVAIAVRGHNFATGAVQNQIEMGSRGSGENYIMSVWPGNNLEELVIDATDVNFRDSDGFSTIINKNPFGLETNGLLYAPGISTFAITNLSSINGTVYPVPPVDPIFGEFLTTATVSVSGANTPTVIALDSFPVGNGVNLDAGDVEFLSDGLYEYSFNVQLDKSGGGAEICDIWLRLNGTDIASSGSRVSVQGSTGQTLAVCSFFVQVVAGDKVALCFASGDSTMAATFFPAFTTGGGDPYDRPSVPAVIVQVRLVR